MSDSLWSKQEDVDAFWRASSCDSPSGDSVLHLAIRKNDTELASHLLDAGYPADSFNDDGKTPLHHASELELIGISKLLLLQGADIFAQETPSSDEGQAVKAHPASTNSDDSAPSTQETRRLDSTQLLKASTPFEAAMGQITTELSILLVKHALSTNLNPTHEYTLLQAMARAFISEKQDLLEAFHQSGWGIERKHSRYRRPFLHYVCEEAEQPDSIKRLKELRADVTKLDIVGFSALHIAAQRGRCSDGSVVKYLIHAGAKIDTKDKYWGATPLIAAVQGKKLANARILLEAGSDPNALVKRGDIRRTVLHLAAQDGTPEMIKLLLEYGANPNVIDELNGSPAQWAIRNNHIEAVRVLLEGNLNPNFDKGHSMQMAIQMRRLEIVELFVKHGATIKRDMIHLARVSNKDSNMRLLEMCVENLSIGDEDTTKNVTDQNIKVGLRLGGFDIPNMMRSDTSDDYRLCALLIEHGYGENLEALQDIPRGLLVCICAEHELSKAVSRLLELGNINKKIRSYSVRPFGWTALHVAAYKGNMTLVKDLSSHGWDLADEDDYGRTALDLAAYYGSVELVQSLLAMYPNAEYRDRDGQTPLHYAVSSNSKKDIRLLECLVAAGCDVSKASVSGETALHRAAQFNLSEVVVWLLGTGSKISAKDAQWKTALHVAASFNAVLVIEKFLSHSAQLNTVTIDGRTPLHCASQAGADNSVITLLDAGADPNKTDGRGYTALATAIHWGKCKPSIINTLLKRTEVDWKAPRASHLVFIAALAVKSPSRASVLGSVIQALHAKMGEKKAARIIKRLMPEMVPEILVNADDSDRGSPADVIPSLLDFLPENTETRHLLLFHMLLSIIKHGGDDDGNLTRRLLLLDDSNVSQEIPKNWGFQSLCCRYGRLKQLRVFLGRGLNPWGRSMVDGVMCTAEDIVKQFSPDLLELFQRLTDGSDVLRSVCIKDPSILPMLGRIYPSLESELQ